MSGTTSVEGGAPRANRGLPFTKENLAEELRQLADSGMLERRRDLLDALIQAINEDRHLEAWAEADLIRIFGDEAVVNHRSGTASRKMSTWELVRNVVLLLPLLITWYGIAMATAAYGNLLDDRPSAGRQPFIQLWESEFQGTAAWYVPSFSQVGGADIVAIIVVMFLSAWVGWKRRQVEGKLAAEEDEQRSRMHATMAKATVYLAARSLDSPDRFAAVANRVADQMEATSGRIEKAAQTVAAMPTHILAAGDRIGEAAHAMTDSVRDLRERLDILTGGLGHLQEGLATSIDQQKEQSRDVRLALEGLRQGSTALTESVESIATVAGELRVTTASSGRATGAMADAATAMQRQSGAIGESVDAMRTQFAELTKVVGDLGNDEAGIGRLIREARESATALARATGLLQELTEALTGGAGQTPPPPPPGAPHNGGGGDDGWRGGEIQRVHEALGHMVSQLDGIHTILIDPRFMSTAVSDGMREYRSSRKMINRIRRRRDRYRPIEPGGYSGNGHDDRPVS